MESQEPAAGSDAAARVLAVLADPAERLRQEYSLSDDTLLKPDRRGAHAKDSIAVMLDCKELCLTPNLINL